MGWENRLLLAEAALVELITLVALIGIGCDGLGALFLSLSELTNSFNLLHFGYISNTEYNPNLSSPVDLALNPPVFALSNGGRFCPPVVLRALDPSFGKVKLSLLNPSERKLLFAIIPLDGLDGSEVSFSFVECWTPGFDVLLSFELWLVFIF
jgi:hypothetical protein